MIPEKSINSDKIQVKMASPIICRNHNRETLKDMYYSFERPEFEKYIKINIEEQMKQENLDSSLLERFKITAINSKKTIIKLYDRPKEEQDGLYALFLKSVEENHIKLKNPKVTLFMIIELVSSTCFDSILYQNPLPIEDYKPYLYDVIRNLLK